MGLLKVIFEYSDQFFTYFVVFFLTDMFYQFLVKISIDMVLFDVGLWQSVLSFRPVLDQYYQLVNMTKALLEFSHGALINK